MWTTTTIGEFLEIKPASYPAFFVHAIIAVMLLSSNFKMPGIFFSEIIAFK